MLPIRSDLVKLLGLFLLVNSSLAQHYDGESYDDEDHSSYNEDSDGPDYSKYYSVDTASSPLSDVKADSGSGFVNPAEFSSFFSPSFYAASNKQEVTKDTSGGFVKPQDFETGFSDFKASPFGGRDFFEQAAQKQNLNKAEDDKYEIKPGPSYVSHKIVPPNAKKPNSNYEAELDDLNKPYNYKVLDNNEEKTIPLYSASKQKIVDPKYTPQYTPKSPNNLNPYQKYSFQGSSPPPQGAATLSTFASATTGRHTLSPTTNTNFDYLYTPTNNEYKYAYDGAATKANSEFKPSPLVKECKKVNKHVPGTSKNSKPMDCYVCKNDKGANYEECFYGSESNPKNYYIESTKEYNEPTQVQNYNFNRYKRYTVSDNDDPYERLKKQSEQNYDNPDYDSSYKHPKSYEDEYRFGPEHFQNGEEKSSSEQVAAELLKSGENCRKVNKDGMNCMVCQNKKTGGNYEQCSYTNAPEEKKYAYRKERKYSSDDEAPEEESDSSEEKPVTNTKPQQFYKAQKSQNEEKPAKQRNQAKRQRGRPARQQQRKSDNEDEVERIKPANTHRHASEYTIPKHFANIQVEPEKAEDDEHDHDDYYYKSFPSESKRAEHRQAPSEESEAEEEEQSEEQTEEQEDEPQHYGYYGEESKKDVEEVLAEFAKKDRSKCKKAEKNGMTCYLCTDKKGLQHEECMYVSESRPQSKYQAYHAQKETDGREGALKTGNKNSENAEESKVKSVRSSRLEPQVSESSYPHSEVTTEGPKKTKRRRPVKASAKDETDKGKSVKKVRRSDEKESFDEPPVEETKDQYRVEGEKGAFSHETEPVYSKQFGVNLPKFMLEKSEGENIYDEFVKAKS